MPLPPLDYETPSPKQRRNPSNLERSILIGGGAGAMTLGIALMHDKDWGTGTMLFVLGLSGVIRFAVQRLHK